MIKLKNLSLSATKRRSLVGACISTIIVGLGVFILGEISGYEAKRLLKASLPGMNLLCNTVVLACTTILALILTQLGFSNGKDSKLNEQHFEHVKWLARVDTILLITALLLLQLSNLPFTESDDVTPSWYRYIYWTSLGVSALVCGGMVGVILMLYQTINNIMAVVIFEDKEHPYYRSKEV